MRQADARVIVATNCAAEDLEPSCEHVQTWHRLTTDRGVRIGAAVPELLLVDCRHDLARPAWGRDAYLIGHIEGAVFAAMDKDLAAALRPGTGRHPLPDATTFAATLGRWGFTDRSQVVVYDQGAGAWAARLWWMLRARGHRAVRVLDGGVAAWQRTGLPLTAQIRAPRSTVVDVREFAGTVSTAAVISGLQTETITLVDARAADRFAGRNETVDPVAGHVPGALNWPYTLNLAADQTFLPTTELAQRWAPLLQRAAGAPLVAMCGSGISACHNILALELAGLRSVKLYAGSFSEWIADRSRPVATGE
jgi:thiosulfate/3-mercaptopyruvate sulfurtransferase